MFVDVACYLFAIGGEAINPEKARTKRIYALIVSFLSLAVLFALSVYFLKESIDGLVNPPPPSDEGEVAEFNEGLVMVVFGLLGILIDGVCLAYGFWWPKYKKRKEDAKQKGANASDSAPSNAAASRKTAVAAGSLSRSMKVANELGMRRSTILLQISPAERLDDVDIADGETHNINTLAAYAHTV
jgi:Co/Zn/Cd efflux system component